MRLYHYTSSAHLRGIDRYGLTVGDVPIDLARNTGRVGVWLTSKDDPTGHGLGGSAVNKSEVRLTVDIPNEKPLWLWDEWSASEVPPHTRSILEQADGASARFWYIYFGWIKREALVEAVSMKTGEVISDWDRYVGDSFSLPAVPYFRKDYWHKQLLKNVQKARSQPRISIFEG
jgi:hypothetical protein